MPRAAITAFQATYAIFTGLMFAAWALSESLPTRITLTRAWMLITLAALLLCAGARLRELRSALASTFNSPQHPLTLALMRITLFALLFSFITPERIAWWAGLPDVLQAPPQTGIPVWPGIWRFSFWPNQPFSAEQVAILGTFMRIVCVVGMLGFASRTCAFIAAFCAFILVGVPQWYGKVDHHHHLVWFMLILALSRCGDALSIDAVIRAWRNADHGNTAPSEPHAYYRRPLVFIWLLIGVIYFFAGWWKLWTIGLDWAIGDNFRWILYNHWHGADHFLPPVRIDRWPVLYQLGAISAVLFELSFVGLVMFRRTRLPIAAAGFMFHAANMVLLRIAFWTLQWCYVAFIDWHRVCAALGRAVYVRPMYVLYDGHCKLCRRTIATLRVLDVLGGITYVNALDREAKESLGLDHHDESDLVRDMHAIIGDHKYVGYDAYIAMAWRNVALMPMLLLMCLPPVRAIGKRIYRRIADSRTCSMVDVPKPAAPDVSPQRSGGALALAAIGTALIVGNIVAGATKNGYAWPLACYPTFDSFYGQTSKNLHLTVLDASGVETPFTPMDHPNYHTSRWRQLVKNILVNEDHARLRALWQVYARDTPAIDHVVAVRFYEDELPVDPARWNEPALGTRLLLQWRVTTHGPTASDQPKAPHEPD